jgi:hypothetical protein
MSRAGINRIALLLPLLLVLAAPSFGQAAPPHPLTNADIVKMVNAGLPEGVIVREIELSGTDFASTPDALISMKQHHVPDGVLAAIVDSQARGMMPQAAGPSVVYINGSEVKHVHQLPNLDATVRLDSHTVGKVQVRKNEIKVEKAGVPLFEVKWKEVK